MPEVGFRSAARILTGTSGKSHRQALSAPARRRCDVLFATLRDGSL